MAWCCSLPLGAAFSSSFRVVLRSTHPSLEWRGFLLLLALCGWGWLDSSSIGWCCLHSSPASSTTRKGNGRKRHHPKKRGTRKKQHHPRGESSTTPKEGAGTISTLCLENTKVLMLHRAKKKGATCYVGCAMVALRIRQLLCAVSTPGGC